MRRKGRALKWSEESAVNESSPDRPDRSPKPPEASGLLALQRVAGNRAVLQLLRSTTIYVDESGVSRMRPPRPDVKVLPSGTTPIYMDSGGVGHPQPNQAPGEGQTIFMDAGGVGHRRPDPVKSSPPGTTPLYVDPTGVAHPDLGALNTMPSSPTQAPPLVQTPPVQAPPVVQTPPVQTPQVQAPPVVQTPLKAPGKGALSVQVPATQAPPNQLAQGPITVKDVRIATSKLRADLQKKAQAEKNRIKGLAQKTPKDKRKPSFGDSSFVALHEAVEAFFGRFDKDAEHKVLVVSRQNLDATVAKYRSQLDQLDGARKLGKSTRSEIDEMLVGKIDLDPALKVERSGQYYTTGKEKLLSAEYRLAGPVVSWVIHVHRDKKGKLTNVHVKAFGSSKQQVVNVPLPPDSATVLARCEAIGIPTVDADIVTWFKTLK